MNIYVYSDESGVFDKVHNRIFVFGGLLFLSKEDKEVFTRKYIHAENVLRSNGNYENASELKASYISNTDKAKLFRSTNKCYRFGIVIHQDKMLDKIFDNKKSKQRFLDYAFKIGLKRYLLKLMNDGVFSASDVETINVCVDEHSTATNGIYELRELLLQEFKHGTFNCNWSTYFPPIFPGMKDITLQYFDSSKQTLIRAADIIANRVWYSALNNQLDNISVFVTHLP